MLAPHKTQAQQPQWTQTYDAMQTEKAYAVCNTDDNNFLLSGYTEAEGAGMKDIKLMKIDKGGTVLQTKTLGGILDDIAYNLTPCRNGGYVVCGLTANTAGNGFDFVIYNLDNDLNIRWQQNKGNALQDGAYKIVQTYDNGFVIGGYTMTGTGGGRDFYLVKLDSLGNTIWENYYGGVSNEYCYALCEATNHDLMIAGSTQSYGAGKSDIYLIRTSSLGANLWEKTIGSSETDIAYDIKPAVSTANNGQRGFLICGKTNGLDGADAYDGLLLKINDNGDQIFRNVYGGSGNECFYSLTEHTDGSIFLSGTTNSFSNGLNDIYIVRTDHWGDVLFETIDGDGENDEARASVMDNEGNILVVGSYGQTSTKQIPWISYFETKCGRWYKRMMWINNLWCLTDCVGSPSNCYPGDILINSLKPNYILGMVNHLKKMKIRKVAIGRAFDMICEDITVGQFVSHKSPVDGNVMRTALSEFIETIRNDAAIDEVYLQIRSMEDERYAGQTTWTHHMYECAKLYNTDAAYANGRFNGMILDYEYADGTYGALSPKPPLACNGCNPLRCQRYWIRTGYAAMLDMLLEGGNIVHGPVNYNFTKFGMYFPGFAQFNLSDIGLSPCIEPQFVGVQGPTHQEIANELEDPKYHLDFINVEMFKKDEAAANSWDETDRPYNWYFNNYSGIENFKYFMDHLYFFGNNNRNTVALNPMLGFATDFLGDYCLGINEWLNNNNQCPDPGVHYIPDIENKHIDQLTLWTVDSWNASNFPNPQPLFPYSDNDLANPNNNLSLFHIEGIDLFRTENDPINWCALTGVYPQSIQSSSRWPDTDPNVFLADCAPGIQRNLSTNSLLTQNEKTNNLNQDEVELLTNPIKENIVLQKAEHINITQIELWDASQKLLLDFSTQELKHFEFTNEVILKHEIISNLKPGIFFLKVHFDKVTQLFKIVKL